MRLYTLAERMWLMNNQHVTSEFRLTNCRYTKWYKTTYIISKYTTFYLIYWIIYLQFLSILSWYQIYFRKIFSRRNDKNSCEYINFTMMFLYEQLFFSLKYSSFLPKPTLFALFNAINYGICEKSAHPWISPYQKLEVKTHLMHEHDVNSYW